MGDSSDDRKPGAIDPEAMRRVEAVIEQLRWTYIREWAPAAIEEIEAAVLALNRMTRTGSVPASADVETLLRVTHDMKGQAGTFGLDLLQDFAGSLHEFVRAADSIGPREAEVFQAHATGMRTVLTDVSAHPDGALDGQIERDLREGLRQLTRLQFN